MNDLLDSLKLIISARSRGFGIDYIEGCAEAAIRRYESESIFDEEWTAEEILAREG